MKLRPEWAGLEVSSANIAVADLSRLICLDMFAFEREGVVPDILTLSKTLGAGLPLGATITTSEIEEVCKQRGFFYYTTHLNDPLVCAVGAKVCEIISRDKYPEQAARKGKILKDGLYQVRAYLNSYRTMPAGSCDVAAEEIPLHRRRPWPWTHAWRRDCPR